MTSATRLPARYILHPMARPGPLPATLQRILKKMALGLCLLPVLLFTGLLGRGQGAVACFSERHAAIEAVHAPTKAAAAKTCACRHHDQEQRQDDPHGDCTDIQLEISHHLSLKPFDLAWPVVACVAPTFGLIAWPETVDADAPRITRGPPWRHPPDVLAAWKSVQLLV